MVSPVPARPARGIKFEYATIDIAAQHYTVAAQKGKLAVRPVFGRAGFWH